MSMKNSMTFTASVYTAICMYRSYFIFVNFYYKTKQNNEEDEYEKFHDLTASVYSARVR